MPANRLAFLIAAGIAFHGACAFADDGIGFVEAKAAIHRLGARSASDRESAIRQLNRWIGSEGLRPTILAETSFLSEAGHNRHEELRSAVSEDLPLLMQIARGNDDAAATCAVFCFAAGGEKAAVAIPLLKAELGRPGLHPARRLAAYCALLCVVDIETSVAEELFSKMEGLSENDRVAFFDVLHTREGGSFDRSFFGKNVGAPKSDSLPSDLDSCNVLCDRIDKFNKRYSSVEVLRLVSLGRLDCEREGLVRAVNRRSPPICKILAIQMLLPSCGLPGDDKFIPAVERLLADPSAAVRLAATYAMLSRSSDSDSINSLIASAKAKAPVTDQEFIGHWLAKAIQKESMPDRDSGDDSGALSLQDKMEIRYLISAVPAALSYGNRGQRTVVLHSASTIARGQLTRLSQTDRLNLANRLTIAFRRESDPQLRGEIEQLEQLLRE